LGSVTSNPVYIATNSTTAVTIDTSQNVGIGTSSPDAASRITSVATATQVGFASYNAGTAGYPAFGFVGQVTSNGGRGAGMYLPADGTLAWSTAGSERMRIDSSGNLLVGTTSGAGQLAVYGSNATAGIFLTKTSGSSNGMVINSATSTTGQVAILNQNNGSTTSYWLNDGSLYLPGGTSGIHTASDERLKKDITYLTDKTVAGYKGLDVVLSLKPVTFRFKTEDESAPLHRGWIAQDFEQHIPELVAENPIPGSEDITPYKAIADGGLIPVLVAAIQELNATITDLQAKLKSAGVAGF